MIDGIENVDLVSVVETAGVDLRSHGGRHIGLCPFHAEKSPSFTIFDDNKFRCFGCGEYGDVIDFVQKSQGLDFKGALRSLGIGNQGQLTPEDRRRVEAEKRRRILKLKFKDWQARYADELGILIRASHMAVSGIKTIEDLEALGIFYHDLERWKYHLWLLVYGDDEVRFELFKDVGDRSHFPERPSTRGYQDEF